MASTKQLELEETLNAALCAKDATQFEVALNDCFKHRRFEWRCEVLIAALREEWHFKHEDLARLIQDLRCITAVELLEWRALNTPAYLEWDDNFALARKCTWALADIGSKASQDALQRLASCSNLVIAGFAQQRLEGWGDELHRKKIKL